MKLINIVFLTCLSLGSCSDDITPTCFQGENRKVVATLVDVKGLVIAPKPEHCPTAYTLTTEENIPEKKLHLLWPCNLPTNFEQDSVKVTYSGYLFKTFATEDVCAQKFEITQIIHRSE